jgi:hypothetical protein
MAYKVKMVQNDTAPPIDFVVTNADGTPFVLTGGTARFKIKNLQSGSITNGAHQTCQLTDPANGKCRYIFETGDIPDAGTYMCDLEVTDSNAKVQTIPDIVQLVVRAEVA